MDCLVSGSKRGLANPAQEIATTSRFTVISGTVRTVSVGAWWAVLGLACLGAAASSILT